MSLFTDANGFSDGGGGPPLSSATPANIGTAAAGSSTDASRADHVHGINVPNGSLLMMAAGIPAAAVPGTNFLAPDWDVVERQSLGADAQDITFAVSAADERILIEGFGPNSTAGASSVITAKFNSTSLLHINASSDTGGAWAAGTSGMWSGANASDIGFWAVADLRASSVNRGIIGICWTGASGSGRRLYFFMAKFDDAATAITQVVFAGSNSTAFKSGFKTIVRRRKMSA